MGQKIVPINSYWPGIAALDIFFFVISKASVHRNKLAVFEPIGEARRNCFCASSIRSFLSAAPILEALRFLLCLQAKQDK
jgi:hypothetical protein